MLALLSLLLAGCVSHRNPAGSYLDVQRGSAPLSVLADVSPDAEYRVALPRVPLATNEVVLSFELEILGGHLSAINRLFDDWDLAVEWDHPARLLVRGQARHFVSGLPGLAPFGNFVTVKRNADEGSGLGLEARLELESCNCCSLEPRRRSLTISGAEMILTPLPVIEGLP